MAREQCLRWRRCHWIARSRFALHDFVCGRGNLLGGESATDDAAHALAPLRSDLRDCGVSVHEFRRAAAFRVSVSSEISLGQVTRRILLARGRRWPADRLCVQPLELKSMKIRSEEFRVRPNRRVNLKKFPTRVKPVYESKEDYEALLDKHREQMSDLQSLLYATDRDSLLLIFQAMDAAGKDGAIKHVMSGVNPQGTQVFSFKHPSPEELDHDFLWRTTRSLPERGRIGIFNRSYYEEVLIVRVHPEILHAERLSDHALQDDRLWKHRYQSINDLERHLHRNGTRIVKFFLHVSKEEQRKRFLQRIDDPKKNWKFSGGDLEERKFWREYTDAYEACLSATSTAHAPWYVVPADDKPTARLIVSKIIVETLRSMKIALPKAGAARKNELAAMRRRLAKDK